MSTDSDFGLGPFSDRASETSSSYYDPPEWAEPPYSTEVPARPAPGQKAQCTFTLGSDLLAALEDPHSPIYHAFPGRLFCGSYDSPFGNRHPHSAIAGLSVLEKDILMDVFDPFFEALRAHPDFEGGTATASWPAADSAPSTFRTAQRLTKHLRESLFGPVGALFKFLPGEHELSIAEMNDQEPETLRIISSAPSDGGVADGGRPDNRGRGNSSVVTTSPDT